MIKHESHIVISNNDLALIRDSLNMTCKKLLSLNMQNEMGKYSALEKSIEYLYFNTRCRSEIEFTIVDRKIEKVEIK